MRTQRIAVFLALLGCCTLLVVHADFGQVIVDEAVDLFATQGDEEGDPRSMEDLLHWAISNSDPKKLAAQAEETQRIQMVKDLKEQRRRVKELLDHVRSQTTETDMIKEGLEILRRSDASDTELLAALQALQVLVEPVDNANDLHPLGGISPVVDQLTRGSQLAAAAAHVLGTASSNNPTFQRHLLTAHPEVVGILLQVSREAHEESAVKGMYALAALVRNLREARDAFLDAGGFQVLQVLLSGADVAARVKRRALSLFVDLVDTEPAVAAAAAAAVSEPGAADADAAAGSPGKAGQGPEGSRAPATGPTTTTTTTASGATFRTILLDEEPAVGAAAGDVEAGGSAVDGSGPQRDSSPGALAAAAVGSGLPEAVVALLREEDADTQEKALLVVQRLADDTTARYALQSSGAVDAISHLRQRLAAEAPEPGNEPDPYHDYLTDLARRVAAMMDRPAGSLLHTTKPASSSSSSASTEEWGASAGEDCGDLLFDSGAASWQGQGSTGKGRRAEEKPPVLALGGPRGRRSSGSGALQGRAVEGRAEARVGGNAAAEVQEAGQCEGEAEQCVL